jgi:hypothetical protein
MGLARSLWHTRDVSLARAVALCALLSALTPVNHAFAQSALLAADQEQDTSLPFRGSTFSFLQTLSASALSKSTQLSYDPQYLWGFSLSLRWYLSPDYSLGIKQGLQLELTDSNTTTQSQQALLTDTNVGFDARLVKWEFADKQAFTVHGQAVLWAPTSLASQAATMTLGTQANAAGVFTFLDWLSGVGLGFELSYLHRFLRSNTVHADTSYPCYTGGTSWNSCQALGSLTNTTDAISVAVLSDVSITTRFALHFVGEYGWYKAAGLADAMLTTSTGQVIDLPDGSLSHWRNTRYLELGASYDVFAWLGLGLAVTNLFSERSYDARVRAPLIPADTAFGLRVLITFDELYLAIRGAPHPDAAPATH